MSGGLVRIRGFIRKEIISVLRQPRLVVTLILGPFLILVLFGLGYRDRPPAFKTELVLPSEQAGLASADLGEAFGSSIELVRTSYDAEEARARLNRGELDLLIIAPDNAVETIEQGNRADFVVAHTEVDPVLRATINLLSRLSIDEINRRVIARVIERAQEGVETLDAGIGQLRAITGELVSAIEAGDQQRAEDLRADLDEGLLEADQNASSDALYESVEEALGTDSGTSWSTLQRDVAEIDLNDPGAVDDIRRVDSSLGELETQLEQAQIVPPEVLVSPFNAEISELARVPTTPALFYGPGALALLIQHLAVTFAALSLVKEKQLGLVEVFRVSPLGVSEALTGKYIAFTVIAGAVTAVLSGAMLVFGARVGDPAIFALTMILMIIASLGLGFLVSTVARTDTQAVQYSMMILLVSIFFTGFVLPLEQLIAPIRVISFLLPATYGILALHELMFRVAEVEPVVIGGLAVYAAVLAVVAWWGMRQDVAKAD